MIIPESMKFVCTANRKYELGEYTNDGCFYTKGVFEKQVLNDQDIRQLIKFGGSIKNVTRGMYFPETEESPFKVFVETHYNLRKQLKLEGGDTPMTDAIKLILNSLYGKTCSKEITVKQ